MSTEEERLRARFAELKRHDERAVPRFEAMWAARRPARSPWRVVVPVTSLAAAAAIVLWFSAGVVRDRTASSSPAVAASAGATPALAELTLDPAPLDFLLDMPLEAPMVRTSGLDPSSLERW